MLVLMCPPGSWFGTHPLKLILVLLDLPLQLLERVIEVGAVSLFVGAIIHCDLPVLISEFRLLKSIAHCCLAVAMATTIIFRTWYLIGGMVT